MSDDDNSHACMEFYHSLLSIIDLFFSHAISGCFFFFACLLVCIGGFASASLQNGIFLHDFNQSDTLLSSSSAPLSSGINSLLNSHDDADHRQQQFRTLKVEQSIDFIVKISFIVVSAKFRFSLPFASLLRVDVCAVSSRCSESLDLGCPHGHRRRRRRQ